MSTQRWIVVDDTDTSINYTGMSWFQDQGSQDNVGNFGPTYRSTLHGTTSSASLSFAFSGTRVQVLGTNNIRNDSGVYDPTWECFVDKTSIGKTDPFQYPENNWFFCEHDQLSDGLHTITVNATIKKGQTFWFDQIRYVPSPSVSFDNAAVMVDDLDPALEFGEGWKVLSSSSKSTNVTNTSFAFAFTGVSLSWYGIIPPNFPYVSTTASYSVDGQNPTTFSVQSLSSGSQTAVYNHKYFDTTQYPAGTHNLTVTYLGNPSMTPLTLDYIIVQNGTSSSTSMSSSTSASSPTSGVPDRSTNTGSHTIGPIVGGVIGGLVLIALAMAAILYFLRRGRRRGKPNVEFDPDEEAPSKAFHRASILPLGAFGVFPMKGLRTSQAGKAAPTQDSSGPNQSTTDLEPLISRARDFPVASELRPFNDTEESAPNQWKSEKVVPAPVVILRPPRSPREASSLSPQNTIFSSGTSRVFVVHKDSGVRLARPEGEDDVLEIAEVPPVYTAG